MGAAIHLLPAGDPVLLRSRDLQASNRAVDLDLVKLNQQPDHDHLAKQKIKNKIPKLLEQQAKTKATNNSISTTSI